MLSNSSQNKKLHDDALEFQHMYLNEMMRWFFKEKSSRAERARRIAKLMIVLVLLGILFLMVPVKQVAFALLSADPWNVLIGMALGFVSVFLTAAQLEPLTRNQGIKHGIGKILEINLAVKFYINFMPTTLIASGYRWYQLAQPGNKIVESLVALGFFRVLETFLTLALGLSFYLLADQSIDIQISIGWLIVILLGIILFWFLITRYSLKIYHKFSTWTGGTLEKSPWKAITRRVEKLLVAVSAYADMPHLDLLLSVSAGILSALSGIASGVYLARAVGIEIDFLNMGWIQAVILFATQLPFTVAGGLGVREVTLVAILANFGVSADLALALSFLIFFRGAILGLVGGLVEAIDSFRGKRTVQAPPNPTDVQKPQ